MLPFNSPKGAELRWLGCDLGSDRLPELDWIWRGGANASNDLGVRIDLGIEIHRQVCVEIGLGAGPKAQARRKQTWKLWHLNPPPKIPNVAQLT
jgi:hypothetical protein